MIDEQLLDQLEKDSTEIASLHKAIGKKEISILKGSIQLTQMSRHVVKIEAQNSTMKKHIWNLLDSFEARFDKDPDQFVAEELQEYIDTAKYQWDHFGRRTHYMVAVALYLEKQHV